MNTGIRRLDEAPDELLTAVEDRLAGLAIDRDALEGRRAEVERQLERLRLEVAHLEGLLALHGDIQPITSETAELEMPASVADQVVSLIREARTALHYAEIERQIRAKGLYSAGGQNPANTLLAKYFNDPRLYRPARGTYGLREWQPMAPSVGTKSARRQTKRGA